MPDVIDLRSDTVTQPTPKMREAMANAAVGDDVFGEDPTLNLLQETIANMLGKEAALFVPSGTMANQIAIHLHTRPGDEMLCEASSHVNVYEAGAPAALSGVTTRPIMGNRGLLTVDDLKGTIQPNNAHLCRTRLLVLENTHNKGGGTVYPLEQLQQVCAWGHDNQLKVHLDGARLFNASVKSGKSLEELARPFHTVSVCFSKGLGAPVGSALAGSNEDIQAAHRVRKMFGGGMRQAGVLAAGCLYALENHFQRLADDHAHAQQLAEAINDLPGLVVDPSSVETNLIWVKVQPAAGSAFDLEAKLKQKGILTLALGPQALRLCTHLHIDNEAVDRTISCLKEVF